MFIILKITQRLNMNDDNYVNTERNSKISKKFVLGALLFGAACFVAGQQSVSMTPQVTASQESIDLAIDEAFDIQSLV
jgi:hypothetical protein